MRINKKLLIGFTFSLFLSATVVLATSSSDYYTKAKKYIDKYCNRSNPSEQLSLNCYLFYKVQEIQSGTAALKVFDNNGVELGIFVDYDTFFYPPLNKLVYVDIINTGKVNIGKLINPAVNYGSIYYAEPNCAGTAYLWEGTFAPPSVVFNSLYPENGNGRYYIVDQSAAPAVKTLLSSYNGTNCENSSNTATVRTLKEVPFPLANPVSLPLQFKYQ